MFYITPDDKCYRKCYMKHPFGIVFEVYSNNYLAYFIRHL